MDKVICDICGTSYPATADQCPICGYEKSADPIMDEEFAGISEPAPAYKPVKGGRFSDANVRKRNKAATAAPVQYDYDMDEEDDEEDDYDEEEVYEEEEEKVRSNKGLVAVLVFLIIAILGLIFYLYFNFFAPIEKPNQETQSPASTTLPVAATTTAPAETEAPTVPCTGLEVSDTEIVLDAIGNAWLLNVVAAPADTTDSITYASSNEAVATVSAEGCITAVGPGEAVITVTCGTAVVECKVSCTIETEPATEPTEAPTEPEETWGLNRVDFTLRVGDRWPLYEGDVSTALITFKARDTSVVTVSKSGVVTGVGVGWTIVTAEYNGVVKECKVFCAQAKTETTPAETTPPATN